MSCNTFIPIMDLVREVEALLAANYIDKDDPRITGGVFTNPTIKEGFLLDVQAREEFCRLVQECGLDAPFGKMWLSRPLYPDQMFVSYEDSGEPQTKWKTIQAVLESAGVFGPAATSLSSRLAAEIDRATTAESEIISRAEVAESEIISRAEVAEVNIAANEEGIATNATAISAESSRAVAAEGVLTSAVVALGLKDLSLQSQVNSIGGGKFAYTTYAEMEIAAALPEDDPLKIPTNASIDVINDPDPLKNGTYGYDGTTITKSPYDPQTIVVKRFSPLTEGVASYKKMIGRTDVIYDTSNVMRIVRTTAKGNEMQEFSPIITQNQTEIDNLKLKTLGLSIYKKLDGYTEVMVDVSGNTRIVSSTATGELEVYSGSRSKPLIAGANISILEDAQSITISAGDTVHATPTEFVLCLVTGQSNAMFPGGDALLAPTVPNLVCRAWDFGTNTLQDINVQSEFTTVVKQTHVPAMALEFYKQTGMGLIVVNAAEGSSAIAAEATPANGKGHWDVGGNLRGRAVNAYKACQAYLNANNICYQNGFITNIHGEQDGQQISAGISTKAQTLRAYNDLIDYLHAELGSKLPFIISRTAYRNSDLQGYKDMRALQMELTHTKPNTYMGYTGAYNFFARGFVTDGVHFSQEGKNILGSAMGKIASKLSTGIN